jgi:AraC-like DNA-binding protein
MDLMADLVRQRYAVRSARFSCPDPARARGTARQAVAGGLTAGMLRYRGFSYSAELTATNAPNAITVIRGSGEIATDREDLRVAGGDVLMAPGGRSFTTTINAGDYVTVTKPLMTASLAEERTGLPAGALRFESMTPVSPAAQRTFARTAEFICSCLVTSEGIEVHALVAAELTRLAAAAFLETFPSTVMTAAYLPGGGWVAPGAARRAADFIDAQAGQPVTMEQIAAEAGVTGRALRQAFYRQFGTTPTGYLRRTRLDRAHQQLSQADPDGSLTIAAVARRWGWASPGRFARAYRQRYGVPPSRTLRT